MKRKLIKMAMDSAGDRSAGTRTRTSSGTHLTDLQNQGTRQDGDSSGADARLDITMTATARTRTARPAKKAERKVDKAHRADRATARHAARRRIALFSARMKAWMEQVNEHDRQESLMGHLKTWGPVVGLWVLGVAMLVNDPLMVTLAARDRLDVPVSTPLWALTPANLAAVAAGLAVSAALFLCAITAGKALATIGFRDVLLAHADKYPAAQESHQVMPVRKAALQAGAALIGLVMVMVLLHLFAASRFSGPFQSGPLGLAMVWLVTFLPVAVVVAEFFTAHPHAEHMRKVTSWALRFRILQFLDVRMGEHYLNRQHRTHRAAQNAVVDLTDVIGDVALRGADEVSESVLAGMVGAAAMTKSPDAGQDPMVLDLTGRPLIANMVGSPVPSNRIRNVLLRYQALAQIPEQTPLIGYWTTLRRQDDPQPGDDTGESPHLSVAA